jgi:Uma2 family endonuclease
MAVPKKRTSQHTIEKYLELDRASEERYEFVDGQVFLMAGESGRHGDISVNLTREISLQLRNKDCRVRSKDTKIKSGGFASKKVNSTKGMFSYPDLVIICGEPEYHDDFKDIVLNPKAVIEVLSDSTEVFDRNNKFTRYRMFNPTLTDYVLVSQDKPMVEHFVRQEDDNWKLYVYIGLDQIFEIQSVECRLKLSDVYDRVEFSEESLELIKEITKIKNERI